MLLGKVAVPSAVSCKFWPSSYEQALDNTLTLLWTQPGYFWSDGLMAMLKERNRLACWLRLEPEDQDPAGLLLSLIAAARRIGPDIGNLTLAAMRNSPGPVAGWEPLFAQLGQEFTESLPENSVVVLEHVHQLAQAGSVAGFLLSSFLPWVTRRFPCVLTSQKPLSLTGLPGMSVEHRLDDLRLDFHSAMTLFKRAHCPIVEDCIQMACQINDGRPVALAGLCCASELLGSQAVETAILETGDSQQLFTRLAQSILAISPPDTPQALAVANQLAYSHPRLLSASVGTEIRLAGPWLQPLSDGWEHVQEIWRTALHSVLQIPAELLQVAVLHAADFLFSQGAVEWAIRIYFQCKSMDSAARAISGVADHYLDLGLWQTLQAWIEAIPPQILEEWPRLVYIQGEIEALSGKPDEAQATLISAGQLYANHQDMDGFCQSKLAESALAIQQNDHNHAWSSALTASTLAARFGLAWQGDWANWQLGRLAAAADKLDDALAFFAQVPRDTPDPLLGQLFDQAASLAHQLQEAKQKREFHRQAYLDLQKSEKETIQQLSNLLNASLPQVKGSLIEQSWSQIHPVLKFSSLSPGNPRRKLQQLPFWQKIAQSLGVNTPFRTGHKRRNKWVEQQGQLTLPLFQSVLFLPQAAQDPPLENQLQTPPIQPPDSLLQEVEIVSANPPAVVQAQPQEAGDLSSAATTGTPSLAVHCLGSFQAFLNDQLIENWPLRKALAIFKYLLVHRQSYVSKEILMDTFWPEADPEAARRNLHQAIYSLRQSLQMDSLDYPYILFVNDRYRLNPDLDIWSDDEDFERHYNAGSQLEKDHQQAQAIDEYEIAIDLYRGNFLAEDLYEDWPASRRAYLWQLYLAMVYRLAEFYSARNEFSIAASFCQRIVYMDDCQEEAHLHLMKCYLAQGKRYQAIQQFYLCRQALKAKLNLTPSPEMQALYRQVIKK